MKKIFLIIVTICMIGLASATITITPPTSAPDVTLTLLPGGDLDEGTTYTFATGTKNSATYTGSSVSYTRSDVNMTSITTNSTHKSINISYEHPGGGKNYWMIGYLENETGWYSLQYQSSLHYSFYDTGDGSVIFNSTDAYPTGNRNTNNLIYMMTQYDQGIGDIFPFRNNKTMGTGKIEIDGAFGTYTIQDIKDAVDDANLSDYFLWDSTTLHSRMVIDINPGASGTLDMTDTNIYFYNTALATSEVEDAKIDMTRSKYYLVGYGVRFNTNGIILDDAVIQKGDYGGIPVRAYAFSSNVYIYYRSYTQASNAFFSGFETQVYEGANMENVNAESVRINNVDLSGNNPLRIIDCSGTRFLIVNTVSRNLTGTGLNVSEVRNFKIKEGELAYDMIGFYPTSNNEIFNLYDFQPYSNYRLSNNTDDDHARPRWQYSPGEWRLHHNISVEAITSNGIPIENATYTVYDNQDNMIYQNTTSSSGGTWGDILTMRITKNMSGGEYDSIYNSSNPLRIVVNKSGYSTYEISTNITKKTTLVAPLSERNWNYSSELKWIARNETNSLLKLDENGNLAIKGQLYENTNSSFINSLEDVAFRIPGYLTLTKGGILYLLGELMEEVD